MSVKSYKSFPSLPSTFKLNLWIHYYLHVSHELGGNVGNDIDKVL